MKREEHRAPEQQGPSGLEDLHVCLDCSSTFVYPVEWEEAGANDWTVLLRCPNCEVHRQGTFNQRTIEAFDEELARGGDALACEYKLLVRANMADELRRFAGALAIDAILPEDF